MNKSHLRALTQRESASRLCGRRLVNEHVVRERFHHKKRKIDPARDIALENRVAHVPAPPDWEALAFTLFEVAPTHDRPPCVAGKYPPAGFHLVIDIRESSQPGEPAEELHKVLWDSEYTSLPYRVKCQPQEKMRRAPEGAWSSTACTVPVEYC